MAAKWEVYETAAGWRWKLKAANGEVVATGEPYSSKAAAINAKDAVERAVREAEVVETEK